MGSLRSIEDLSRRTAEDVEAQLDVPQEVLGMFRKMMLLGAALAAFVTLAAPAAHAEEPLVTNENGEPAWHVTGAGVDVTFTTEWGRYSCATVGLTLTLTANTNGTAHGSGTGDATGDPLKTPPTHTGHCFIWPGGLPFAFTSVTVKDIHLEENGGSIKFGYTYDITYGLLGSIPCGFTGTADLSYATGDDTIVLSNGTLVGTKNLSICPATGAITGQFVLKDENEGTVVLD